MVPLLSLSMAAADTAQVHDEEEEAVEDEDGFVVINLPSEQGETPNDWLAGCNTRNTRTESKSIWAILTGAFMSFRSLRSGNGKRQQRREYRSRELDDVAAGFDESTRPCEEANDCTRRDRDEFEKDGPTTPTHRRGVTKRHQSTALRNLSDDDDYRDEQERQNLQRHVNKMDTESIMCAPPIPTGDSMVSSAECAHRPLPPFEVCRQFWKCFFLANSADEFNALCYRVPNDHFVGAPIFAEQVKFVYIEKKRSFSTHSVDEFSRQVKSLVIDSDQVSASDDSAAGVMVLPGELGVVRASGQAVFKGVNGPCSRLRSEFEIRFSPVDWLSLSCFHWQVSMVTLTIEGVLEGDCRSK